AVRLFSFEVPVPHRDLRSFPTRRSSDLKTSARHGGCSDSSLHKPETLLRARGRATPDRVRPRGCVVESRPDGKDSGRAYRDEVRSEEHTSELQSQSNLVCRLLLEKKKQS